jgi:hypothetical protein
MSKSIISKMVWSAEFAGAFAPVINIGTAAGKLTSGRHFSA